MKNEKVSLKLKGRTVDNKIEFSKSVVLKMTGNSNFPSAVPSLAQISAAALALDNARIAAINGGVDKTAAQTQQEAILDNLMLRLGNYVEGIANAAVASGGDARAIITSAGMDYKRDRTITPVPAAPLNVKAASTQTEGEIYVSWDAVHQAYVYVIEITTDPSVVGTGNRTITPTPGALSPAVWTQVKILTQKKFTLSNLTSATKYAIRIYGVGTHGESPYSNVVVAKAL